MRIWSYPGIYPFPEKGDHTTGIFIHKQNLALKALGADVSVIQTRDWYPIWPFYNLLADWKRNQKKVRPAKRELDGIKIFHPLVIAPKPSRLFNKPHGELVVDAICSFLEKQGVKKGQDFILAQWLIPDGYHAVLAAQRLGIQVAVEMQGDDIQVWPHHSPTHLTQAKWVLENADLMLGCSDFLGNEAKKLYIKPLTVHTIYTGIDPEKFKPLNDERERAILRKSLGLNDNDIAILNVGSAIARKGWNELFESVSSLKENFPNVKILAASGGLSEFKLSELAQKYNVEANLIDLGSVPNNRLPSLYQACDIFCLPSYWEGLANVLCEALASGCAVVTTAVSGHPEVVFPGENGELVTPKNVTELTSALRKVIESPALKQKYQHNARKTALDKIQSHEANAQKIIDLFNQLK